MDLEINYDPLEWQKKAHSSSVPHQCCVGGLGCTREDSLIETARGRIPIGDTIVGDKYKSFDSRSGRYVFQEGSVGFPKGKSNLYRVIHDQGEFVVNEHHLVLTAQGIYSRICDLSVGCEIFLAQEGHDSSILEHDQKLFPEDVLHWKKIVLDSLNHYAVCIRRYGQQLLNQEVFYRLFSPLQAYALRFSHNFYQEEPSRQDDQALCMELKHIQNDHKFSHVSTKDYTLQMERDEVVVLNEDFVAKPFERILLDTQQSLQSPKICEYRQKDRKSFFYRKYEKPFYPLGLTQHKSTIRSIEKTKEEWFWDIQVPETNNYISGGAVHHNSGKTSYAIRELQACALNNPKGLYLIGRATLPSLRDSTYRSFFEHTEPQLIKHHNKANLVVTLINDAEFIFRPLDDMEKFKSMQISGFFLDEANEITEEMYQTLRTRVRQIVGGRIPFYRTIIAHNPGEEHEWIPRRFVHRKVENEEIIFSTTMDNQRNLPPNYIEDLKMMYSEDMQKRMIYGQYGKVFKGNPVFPQYARGEYLRRIEPVQGFPIYRGIDFGFNKPAVSWMQYINGQVRIYQAIKGEKIYLDDFIRDVILPEEQKLFPRWNAPFKTVCDPAGSQESDKGRSSVDILNEFGIFPMYKKTKVEEGIRAIKHFLDTKNAAGEPNFLVHPRADLLNSALKGGYCWDDKMKLPDKTKGYDDIVDSARYPITYIHKWAKAGALINNEVSARRYISKTGSRSFEI